MLNREKQRKAEEEQKKGQEAKERQKEIIDSLVKEVDQLKDQLKASEIDKNEADYNRSLLEKLYDNDVIDREGRPLPYKHEDEPDPNDMH